MAPVADGNRDSCDLPHTVAKVRRHGATGTSLQKRTWYISGIDLFRGLAERDINNWAAQCGMRRFDAGERIIDARSTLPEQVLVVRKGAVRLILDDARGRPQTVDVLGPGQLFGVSCAFGTTPTSLHADALSQVMICVAEGRDFLTALARAPQIVLNLVQQIGASVLQSDAQAQPQLHIPAHLRLLAVIERLAMVAGQPVAGGQQLPSCVTRATLARQTGCARETVARLLAQLENQRCIRRELRAIIVDPERTRRKLRAVRAEFR